jgi:hypothetical protein
MNHTNSTQYDGNKVLTSNVRHLNKFINIKQLDVLLVFRHYVSKISIKAKLSSELIELSGNSKVYHNHIYSSLFVAVYIHNVVLKFRVRLDIV